MYSQGIRVQPWSLSICTRGLSIGFAPLSEKLPRPASCTIIALGLGTEKVPSRVGRLIDQRENRSMEGLSDLFEVPRGAYTGTGV